MNIPLLIGGLLLLALLLSAFIAVTIHERNRFRAAPTPRAQRLIDEARVSYRVRKQQEADALSASREHWDSIWGRKSN